MTVYLCSDHRVESPWIHICLSGQRKKNKEVERKPMRLIGLSWYSLDFSMPKRENYLIFIALLLSYFLVYPITLDRAASPNCCIGSAQTNTLRKARFFPLHIHLTRARNNGRWIDSDSFSLFLQFPFGYRVLSSTLEVGGVWLVHFRWNMRPVKRRWWIL